MMAFFTSLTVGATIVVFCLWQLYIRFFGIKNNSGFPLPPGPKGEPILGHFRIVPLLNPEFSYMKWGKEFASDVLYFNILGRPVVVLNSVEAANDLLSKRGANYGDRPRFVLFEVMGWGRTLTFLRWGPKFKQHRQLIQSGFSASNIVQYRPMQEKEARIAASAIAKRPQDWENITKKFSSAIVLDIGFGVDIDDESHPYLQLAEDANFATTNGGTPASTLVDYFPFVRHLPNWLARSGPLKHARDSKKFIQAIQNIPFARLQQEMKDGIARPSISTTLLRQYAMNEEKGVPNDLEFADIKGAAGAIFIAGANTTWSTIIMCILNLLLHPEVCRKAQKEIDSVVGSNRLPSFQDREALRYVDYIVQEAYRWAPLSPVGVPHRSLKDDVYKGMFIPAGSVVYANARAMAYDEKTYKEPSKFNPDRFLPKEEGGDGEPFAQGPFGFGRRVCPGQYLATASVWIILTTMLATLDIVKPIGADGKEIEPVFGMSNGLSSHPEHFAVTFKPRSKQAEELLAMSG